MFSLYILLSGDLEQNHGPRGDKKSRKNKNLVGLRESAIKLPQNFTKHDQLDESMDKIVENNVCIASKGNVNKAHSPSRDTVLKTTVNESKV